MIVLAVVAVFGAAILHRITGIGFALVAMPVLVLVYGPTDGIRLLFVFGLAASLVALALTWRHVTLRRSAALSLLSCATVPLGAVVAAELPGPILLIGIGLLLIGTLVLVGRPAGVHGLRGHRGLLVAGTAAGFIHATSGLSAPVLTAYAISDGWEQRSFAASAQVVFISLNLASLAALRITGQVLADGLRLAVLVVVGMGVGAVLSRYVSAPAARRAMLVVAWASAAAAIIRGIAQLL